MGAVFFAGAFCASSAMAHEVVKGGGWGGKPWQGLVWQGPTYGHKVDETNYSGPKANPIVVKNIGYGYDSHGYGDDSYGYGYKDLYGYGGGYNYGYDDSYGYGYYAELPRHGGVRYLRYSKPTGFLYSPGRY